MVDLMLVYERAGFEITVRELPDYLPLYLEFLSERPEDVVRDGLQEVAHILRLLAARLTERNSPYAVLFDALLVIAGVALQDSELQAKVAKEQRDDTLEALDRFWEEEMVTFMGDDAAPSCGSGRSAATPQQADKVAPIHWVDQANTSASSQGARRNA
jgi:nitrate reductase delta subunit